MRSLDCTISERLPRIVVSNVAEFEAGALGEGLHGIPEPASPLRKFEKLFIHGLVGVICQSEALDNMGDI